MSLFRAFRPASTQAITENLYVVRCGFVNFYVLKTANGVVLFDTGINALFAKKGLGKLGISAETVTHIYLTHTDYDHMGGIAAFPKADRHISKAEEQMINGKTARRGFLYNSRLSDYHVFENGKRIDVDNISILPLLTPGHTPGSTIYLIDNRYLVTGDLLRISQKGKIKPFLRLMNKNHKQNIESIKDKKDIIDSAEYILTGHTGFYKK